MTAVRLNAHIRASIVSAALRHRFADEALEISEEHAAVANAAYLAQYTPAKLKQLEALPADWCNWSESFQGNFGGQQHTFYFSGYNHRWNRSTWEQYCKIPKSVDMEDQKVWRRRFLGKKPAFSGGTPIVDRVRKYVTMVEKFNENHLKVRHTIEGTLSQYTMLNALVKAWPEIEQFVPKVEQQIIQLPAIPVAELNKMLELAA